jgi:TupA-like ATPgrasp
MGIRPPERFTELLHLRFTRAMTDFKRPTKQRIAAVCAETQVRSPKILKTFRGASALSFESLPDCFVLKPDDLASKRGVMVLHRIAGDDGYWDAMARRRVSPDRIRNLMQAWEQIYIEHRQQPFIIVAQERIFGENTTAIPFDYKLYTFNGEVKFIFQIDRNGKQPGWSFFINDFESFDYSGRMWVAPNVDVIEPIVPSCGQAMLDMARKVSTLTKSAFVSVDCYATKEGPVVGELTYAPGAMYHGNRLKLLPDFDCELGAAWLRAATALNIDVPMFDEDEPRKNSQMPHRPGRSRELAV